MTTFDKIKAQRADVLEIARAHGAKHVRVFGSVLRGEERADSDIDLLVNTADKTSDWFPAGLILDLEELFGRPVDVVTERGLNPFLREEVLREARAL